jgi:hypothetical protein
MRRFLPLVLLVVLAPTAADAATLTSKKAYGLDARFTYTAAPGETNQLKVTIDDPPTKVGDFTKNVTTITDPGATFTAPDPVTLPKYMTCANSDTHTVVCKGRSFPRDIRAELGDGDDSELVSGDFTTATPDVRASGGPGNDKLDGIGFDRLDGGPGTDVVRGGDLDDVIVDADAEPDDLDGGDDDDTLSFAGSDDPVVADLNADTVESTGEPLKRFEKLTGGNGDDRLTGADGSKLYDNEIEGGPGDDVLRGEGGADYLRGGPGDDTLVGGSGKDQLTPGAGRDQLRCGGQADAVVDPEPGEVLGGDCEEVTFVFEKDAGTLGFLVEPRQVKPGKLRFEMACPDFEEYDGEEIGCDIPIELREAGGRHRLLGSGHIHRKDDQDRFYTHVYLTPLGVKLSAGGVLTTGKISYRGGLSWTFTLTI